MEKATALQMKDCLRLVDAMKNAGIRFVPMPVKNEKNFAELMRQMMATLTEIGQEVGRVNECGH